MHKPLQTRKHVYHVIPSQGIGGGLRVSGGRVCVLCDPEVYVVFSRSGVPVQVFMKRIAFVLGLLNVFRKQLSFI